MAKNHKRTVRMVPEKVSMQGASIDVWPPQQRVQALNDPTVHLTDFEDAGQYHDSLIQNILELEKSPRHVDKLFKGGCGIKVRRLEEWPFPAAKLINARALRMCREILGQDQLFVDDAWGNIYRTGDYCMPHSHLRSHASVVYFLTLGDEDSQHPMSGRFCIGDPRVKACCQMEEDRMTHTMVPDVKPGSMIMFPSELVHFVNPYTGRTPRITLSWNINLSPIAGNAGDRWKGDAVRI